MWKISDEFITGAFFFTIFLYFSNPIGLVCVFILGFLLMGFFYWKLKKGEKENYQSQEKIELIRAILEIEKERSND